MRRHALLALALAGCASAASSPDAAPLDAPPDSAPDAAADLAPDAPPRQPACVTVAPLRNGDFETPPEGTTIPGWTVEKTGLARVIWEPVSGYAGSAALGFTIAEGDSATARQSLALEPYTSYSLRARFSADGIRPRGDGNLLFLMTVRSSDRTWTIGPRKGDYTDFDFYGSTMDFTTGAQGMAVVELRTAAGGHYLIDEIVLSCNDRTQHFETESLVATLYDDQVQTATPAAVAPVLANVDRAIHAYADLTGVPIVGRLSSFPLRYAAVTETRGDPSLWNAGISAAQWALPGFVPAMMTTSLARNFDRPAWIFDDDFAELPFAYALETLGLRVGTNDATDLGRAYRTRLEQRYRDSFQPARCADAAGLVYKDLLISDQLGWEPFKATFRALATLPAASIPTSRWGRLKLFHDKLAELSGQDVWAMFTPQDRAALEAHYNVPPAEVPRPLADLPATTLTASLASTEWESATVGRDSPARNRLGNDCPMVTAAGPAPVGLFAHAFSQYVFRLGRSWKRLTTSYALQSQQMGSVIFVVRGDGRELHRSPLVKDSIPRSVDLDISTVDRLELLVLDNADGAAADVGLWLSPQVTR